MDLKGLFIRDGT